ncbi:MAG TPA: methyltransferase domain-containing protein [Gammaproteobacteria bacterium]|nr:methyltransferase domain-containing protein [Gammaproteobacteria bacterium]
MNNNIERLLASGKLRCPACSQTLQLRDSVHCEGCGRAFPLLTDIPVLMPDPDEFIGLWQNRLGNFVASQQRNIESNRRLIASPDTYPPLKERLERVTRARAANLETLLELMAPQRQLGPGRPPTEHTDALGSFMLIVYLLRDWGWDTGEVDILCDKVIEILPDDLDLESLLVLGAGACRDSFNLHKYYGCPFTVSVDIAPLMLLGARRIVSGGELNLYQIQPNNVRNAADNVSYWQLRAPGRPEGDFLYMLADAMHLPFAEGSFQVILTPFLIDAVGEDLREFAPRIGRLLQAGGYWVNYGAMSFRPGMNYTAEEVLDIVADSGFRILEHGFSTKPHLAPRESCQRTVYDCLYFSAVRE